MVCGYADAGSQRVVHDVRSTTSVTTSSNRLPHTSRLVAVGLFVEYKTWPLIACHFQATGGNVQRPVTVPLHNPGHKKFVCRLCCAMSLILNLVNCHIRMKVHEGPFHRTPRVVMVPTLPVLASLDFVVIMTTLTVVNGDTGNCNYDTLQWVLCWHNWQQDNISAASNDRVGIMTTLNWTNILCQQNKIYM